MKLMEYYLAKKFYFYILGNMIFLREFPFYYWVTDKLKHLKNYQKLSQSKILENK